MNSPSADSPTTTPVPATSQRLPCPLRSALVVMLLTWIGNLLIRWFGVMALAPDAWSHTSAHEWVNWFWYGFRYDALLVSRGAAVWLLPLAFVRAKFAGTVAVRMAFVAGLMTWFVVLNASMLLEHAHLHDFGVPFGVQVFGGFRSDAVAIVMAADPRAVVMALLGGGALAIVQTWCALRFALVVACEATWRDAVLQVLVVSTVFVVGWGRPAERLTDPEGISVARDPTLDDLLVNTPVRLYLALRQYRGATRANDSPEQAASRALRAHGFADAAALAAGLPSDERKGAAKGVARDAEPETILRRAAWHRTPINDMLAAHPPHIVFGLMEGWGGYGLSLDADGFPIAGAMRRHLDAGWWFRHAVAARADTFSTLEHLLISSGRPTSVMADGATPLDFESAVTRPFRQHGYRTVFIYGGARSWRHIDRVMRRLGFDTVLTQADIIARYPRADTGNYGVYDGYLWRYVHDLLEEADATGQPLFVFALTMSNHPPFDVPRDAATGPFDLTKGWRASPADETERRARLRAVRAYRYAMDSLGDFIDRLKYSPMGSRTILVATGDHRAPQWRDRDNAVLSPFEQYHVPIYLRVPVPYLPQGRLRLDDFVGHRDIFPTLYRLALSDAPYVGFGEPLFGEVPQARRYAVAQQRYLFSTAGAQDLVNGMRYAHAEGGDPAMLKQQVADANTSLALTNWYTEMQRRTTPMSSISSMLSISPGG